MRRDKRLVAAIAISLLLIGGLLIWIFSNNSTQATKTADLIRVDFPIRNEVVTSPLIISGEARGLWYFEATFPVKLLDAQGRIIGVGFAEAQSDWMTEEFVPFKAVLRFEMPSTKTGRLVLEKNNASGLPEHDDSLTVEIRF